MQQLDTNEYRLSHPSSIKSSVVIIMHEREGLSREKSYKNNIYLYYSPFFAEVRFSLFFLVRVVFRDSKHSDAVVECNYPDRP